MKIQKNIFCVGGGSLVLEDGSRVYPLCGVSTIDVIFNAGSWFFYSLIILAVIGFVTFGILYFVQADVRTENIQERKEKMKRRMLYSALCVVISLFWFVIVSLVRDAQ